MQRVQKLVNKLADPQGLVGKKVVETATGNAAEVLRSSLPSGTRVLAPGAVRMEAAGGRWRGTLTLVVGLQMATMDYRPTRLNLNTDASGVVKSYHYG